ncbi:hypothetical protein CYMTET_41159, partial [Cymbomonas tetramitiformis]
MFLQRLNRCTGEVEWVCAGEGTDEEDPTLRVSGSAYLDMLSDHKRNVAYHAALKEAVAPGSSVLDIGTGTGLLAMMAARVNDSAAQRVFACETFPPMRRLARKLIGENDLMDRITLVDKRSDDMGVGPDLDLPIPADVLVTEIFDSELLGEGLLPTLRDAVGRLVKPGGAIIPAAATVYAQVVECPTLALHTPESVAHNLGTALGWDCKLRRREGGVEGGVASSDGTMMELHVDALNDLRPLTDPFACLHFDLGAPPAEDSPLSCTTRVTARSSGRVDALVVWWELEMDSSGTLRIDTAPWYVKRGRNQQEGVNAERAASEGAAALPEQAWRDHWKQCVWILRRGGSHVARDETIVVGATHDDVSLSFVVDVAAKNAGHGRPPCAVQGSGSGSECLEEGKVVLPEAEMEALHRPCARTWALSDPQRSKTYAAALARALRGETSGVAADARAVDATAQRGDDVVLSLGEGIVMPLLAAQAGSRVVALQPSPPTKRLLAAAAAAAGFPPAQIRSLNCAPEQLPPSICASVLVSEPFYAECAGQVPWAQLRYWYDVCRLRESCAITPQTVLLPCRATLCGVGASLPELARTRRPAGVLEGVNLLGANALLGASAQPGAGQDSSDPLLILPQSVWQCGGEYSELTAHFDLLHFDFGSSVKALEGEKTVPAQVAGVCDVIVLWLEWHLDTEVPSCSVSGAPAEDGAPMHTEQGVKILSCPQMLVPPLDGTSGASMPRAQEDASRKTN